MTTPTLHEAARLALAYARGEALPSRQQLIDTLEAALSAQPAEPVAWIPVTDRLPEPDSGEVLVWLASGGIVLDEWHTYREDPTGMSTTHTLDMGCMWRQFAFEEVTHWMPLPAAPGAAAPQPARVPQPVAPTDEQIDALKWHLEAERSHEAYTGNEYLTVTGHREFARAVLAAAGITAEGGANG